MTKIDREQLKQMMDQDAVIVVDVLGAEAYDSFHLPGAINVPVGDDFEEQIREAVPDQHQPVAVYCLDEACNASPTAARRMESLGYDRVYDYAAGKLDWRQAGLPVER